MALWPCVCADVFTDVAKMHTWIQRGIQAGRTDAARRAAQAPCRLSSHAAAATAPYLPRLRKVALRLSNSLIS